MVDFVIVVGVALVTLMLHLFAIATGRYTYSPDATLGDKWHTSLRDPVFLLTLFASISLIVYVTWRK